MRLLAILLCLSHLAFHVTASIAAGKYQWVFLWYSYRMNVEVYTATGGDFPMLIAPLCRGSVGDGIQSCTLDEFLEQTYDKSRPGGNARTRTGVSELLPTSNTVEHVDDLATRIFTAGWGSAYFDPYKISPNEYKKGASNPGLGFVKIMETVMNNVQRVRAKLGDSPVQGPLDACKQAMVRTTEGRIEENRALMRDALEETMDAAGFKMVYLDAEKTRFDLRATIATNRNPGVSWKKAVRDYVRGSTGWGADDEKTLLTHLHALTNCGWWESQLASPVSC